MGNEVTSCVLGVAAILCVGACGSRTGFEAPDLAEGGGATADAAMDAASPGFDATFGDVQEEPMATCGPATCSGCCESDGTCVSPPNADACGTGGEACVKCPGPMPICNKPAPGCIQQVAHCTTQNCAGCCIIPGGPPLWEFCSTGLHASACGYGGQECMACEGMAACVSYEGGGQCTGTSK
jgi:hypothetical protein